MDKFDKILKDKLTDVFNDFEVKSEKDDFAEIEKKLTNQGFFKFKPNTFNIWYTTISIIIIGTIYYTLDPFNSSSYNNSVQHISITDSSFINNADTISLINSVSDDAREIEEIQSTTNFFRINQSSDNIDTSKKFSTYDTKQNITDSSIVSFANYREEDTLIYRKVKVYKEEDVIVKKDIIHQKRGKKKLKFKRKNK